MVTALYSLIIIILTTSKLDAQRADDAVSPCPDVFQYVTQGENAVMPLSDRWYGMIKISTDVTLHSLYLHIMLDNKADLLGSLIGEVTTDDNCNFKIESTDIKITPGQPRAISFFVKHGILFTPKVNTILFNGKIICGDNETLSPVICGISNNITTNIYTTVATTTKQQQQITNSNSDNQSLNSVQTTTENDYIEVWAASTTESNNKTQTERYGQLKGNQFKESNPMTIPQTSTESATNTGTLEQTNFNDRFGSLISDEEGDVTSDVANVFLPNFREEPECGKVTKKQPQNLPYGSTTFEGQWPWHVAIYQHRNVAMKYICGGTLLSDRHVITAAHCVTKRKAMTIVKPRTLIVYLGKFNLRLSGEGVQVQIVNGIIVHPEYNSINYSRDLAILILRSSVTLTDWVRPVCLWPEDEISIINIVGKTGSVVGWSLKNTDFSHSGLNLNEMTVPDQKSCVKSKVEPKENNTYTYCAVYKNDTLACYSDSGGSMVFKKGSTWYLRGFVSISVSWHNEHLCDSNHYILFTDVAMFLSWIRDNID